MLSINIYLHSYIVTKLERELHIVPQTVKIRDWQKPQTTYSVQNYISHGIHINYNIMPHVNDTYTLCVCLNLLLCKKHICKLRKWKELAITGPLFFTLTFNCYFCQN